MELVKVPTPSKRNLGAERQTENDLTAPRSTKAHTLEGFEKGGIAVLSGYRKYWAWISL